MLARWLVLVLFVVLPQSVLAERRVALVIGNGAYQRVPVLANAPKDAQAVAATLRKLDFEVIRETDLDKIGMEQVLKRFARLASGADVALFYYSGHAVQFMDRNYLLPVSANIAAVGDVPLETTALQDVTALMQAAKVKSQLIFLDACRDNPFRQALAGAAAPGGLARVSTSIGSLVAFSTSPGAVAFDGAGDLSPFTASFIQRALEPKVEIRQALTKVRNDVIAATGGRQVPWDDSSLTTDFYLVPRRPGPVFDKLQIVALSDPRQHSGPIALGLAPPHQPEGGEVHVQISTTPRFGTLFLRERALGQGDRLPASELSRVAYAPASSDPRADAFSFHVRDAWGNDELGAVTIGFASGGVASVAPARISPAIGALNALGRSVLGLGPNLRLTSVPDVSDPQARGIHVRLASSLTGELTLGERKIDVGKSIQLEDIRHLRFLPASGTDEQEVQALFLAEAPASGEVKLQIRVEMHECDRLAGARLDPQGVSDGVLSGNIDVDKAREACEAAVRAHPQVGRFHYQLARTYLAARRHQEALRALERAIALGHARAHVDLGYIYAVGAGVPRDDDRARQEYAKAAALNDVFGIHALGKLYYDGRGVPRDVVKAREHFERSARVGHTYSMNNLGRMYLRGEGVERDPALARRYWEQAAARGDIYGIHNMGYVHLDGIAGEKSPAQAIAYFRRAAELGHPEAPNSIGRLFFHGIGVDQDLAEAAHWYRLGAERGDGWAALNLAELYRSGRGVRGDLVDAAIAYAQAAGSYNLEPARQAQEQLRLLPHPAKAEALRRLLQRLESRAAADPGERDLLRRAKAFAAKPGARAGADDLDGILVSLARLEWERAGARLDLF